MHQNSLQYFITFQCRSQAVVCVSTPRMYPWSGYFLVLTKVVRCASVNTKALSSWLFGTSINVPFFKWHIKQYVNKKSIKQSSVVIEKRNDEHFCLYSHKFCFNILWTMNVSVFSLDIAWFIWRDSIKQTNKYITFWNICELHLDLSYLSLSMETSGALISIIGTIWNENNGL